MRSNYRTERKVLRETKCYGGENGCVIYNNVGEQKVAIGLTNAAVRVRGCTRFKVHIISLSLELALPVSVQPAYCLHRLYLSLEDKFDKEHGDSWSGSMDVLVFVRIRITFRGLIHRLFSVTVATSIVASYPNLQPNSSDTTVLLLAQILQQLAALANGPPSPSAVTLRRHPPQRNCLPTDCFCCARQHALVHQSQHEFNGMQVADWPYSPPKRARIRAYFADGIEKFAFAAAVEVLPVLLHPCCSSTSGSSTFSSTSTTLSLIL